MAVFTPGRRAYGAGMVPMANVTAASTMNLAAKQAAAMAAAAQMGARARELKAREREAAERMGFQREKFYAGMDQAAADRQARIAEAQAGRQHALDLMGRRQAFQAEQAGLGREHELGRIGQTQEWQARQAELGREHALGMQTGQQTFQAEQNEAARAMQQAQFEAMQDYRNRQLEIQEAAEEGRITRWQAEQETRRAQQEFQNTMAQRAADLAERGQTFQETRFGETQRAAGEAERMARERMDWERRAKTAELGAKGIVVPEARAPGAPEAPAADPYEKQIEAMERQAEQKTGAIESFVERVLTPETIDEWAREEGHEGGTEATTGLTSFRGVAPAYDEGWIRRKLVEKGYPDDLAKAAARAHKQRPQGRFQPSFGNIMGELNWRELPTATLLRIYRSM